MSYTNSYSPLPPPPPVQQKLAFSAETIGQLNQMIVNESGRTGLSEILRYINSELTNKKIIYNNETISDLLMNATIRSPSGEFIIHYQKLKSEIDNMKTIKSGPPLPPSVGPATKPPPGHSKNKALIPGIDHEEWNKAIHESLQKYYGNRSFVQITAGEDRIRVLKQDGTVWDWGSNPEGKSLQINYESYNINNRNFLSYKKSRKDV